MPGCLKKSIWRLIIQNKFFGGTIDVIFDDPYLNRLGFCFLSDFQLKKTDLKEVQITLIEL